MNFQNANVVYIEVYYNEGNEGYEGGEGEKESVCKRKRDKA